MFASANVSVGRSPYHYRDMYSKGVGVGGWGRYFYFSTLFAVVSL